MLKSLLILTCLALALSCLGVLGLLCLRLPPLRPRSARLSGFCDLLEYATLADEEIIVLKNGSLCRIYELSPGDQTLKSERELSECRERFARALLKLGGGWCLQVDAVRREDAVYRPAFAGPRGAAAYFDAQREALLRREPGFKSTLYLTLTYRPDRLPERFLSELFAREKSARRDPREATAGVIAAFRRDSGVIARAIALACPLRPLGEAAGGFVRSHEGLSFIRECLYGERLPAALPRSPVFLDALLSSRDFTPGLCPKAGDRYIAVVAVDGLPSESLFLVLSTLSALRFEYRFNTRFICLSLMQSHFNLLRHRRLWQQKSRGILAQIFNQQGAELNADALEQLSDLSAARRVVDSGEQLFGSYSAGVIIMDRDFERLGTHAAQAVREIERLGFGARIETVNATEAYLGSLPGHVYENPRRCLVSSAVLGDLLPLSVPFEGELHSPNPLYGPDAPPLMQARAPDGSNVCVNLHDRDLGNALVIGPSGTGKSVFLGHLMLSLMRYPGMRIFCFDKGAGFYALSRAVGGECLPLRAAGSLCPLEYLESPGDLSFAADFIETVLTLNGLSVLPEERLEIGTALGLLAARGAGRRTLGDLLLLLGTRRLKDVLAPYARGGLLDGERNPVPGSAFTLIECLDFMESPARVLVPVLKTVFRLIARALDGRQPGAIVLDEAWLMLKNERFALELLKWFKTLRKYNVAVILATQSLSDLASSPVFEALIDCAKTRFFLPNPDAREEPAAGGCRRLGLTDVQIERIASGVKKRDIFLRKGPLFMPFSCLLPERELELLSLAGEARMSAVDALVRERGAEFYKEKGWTEQVLRG